MNFDKMSYLVPIVVILCLYLFLYYAFEKKIAKIIKDNWLLDESKKYLLRKVLYIVGVTFLFISVLDLRGPEDRVESNLPDQKTIIIIDSSASMLTEDVRPSRYKKSLLLARHFIKKAVGHQISIVLFSDRQNRLVPFTDDLDLLDARVASLEDNNDIAGGSNISQAIEESLSYFRSSAKNKKEMVGNILILTDSEGHDGSIKSTIPDGINVGIVGVGTVRGGKVPIRDSRGVFRGYKKFNGREVESKLNEAWIKGIGKKVKNFKYWIVNSYMMPTESIVQFFRNNFLNSLAKGSIITKPVWAEYLIVPGLLALFLSFILYPLKRFTVNAVIVMAFMYVVSPSNIYAEEGAEKPHIEMTEEGLELEEKLRQGDISKSDALYLAGLYLRQKDQKRAEALYEEYKGKLDVRDMNNYGLSKLYGGKNKEALQIFEQAQEKALKMPEGEGKKEILKVLKKNILKAIKKNKQDKQKQKQQKKDQKNKDKNQKDQKKNDQGQSSEKSQNKQSKQDGKNEKDGKKGKQKKDKNKKDDQSNKDGKESKMKPQTPEERLAEKEKEQQLKRKMKKVPGIIKQIMSDDRKLQKKFIDTSTKKRRSSQEKDW